MREGIGFFDSGIGGLTVMSEFVRRGCSLPLYYYGDNRHAPYGDRSEKEIYSFTKSACRSLVEGGVKGIVLACNTATAVCIDGLRKELSVPVLGVEPAIKPACERHRRVLLLCTPVAAQSGRVRSLVLRYRDRIRLQAPKNLARAIEESVASGKSIDLSEHLFYEKAEAVVLGCTHYVFEKERISSFFGCPAFDGGKGVYDRAKSVFHFDSSRTSIRFVGENSTANAEAFFRVFGRILGQVPVSVEK